MNWSYFNKFEPITDRYLPDMGQGDTVATQIVTAVCKLVYKWYNDGDVYDNQGRLDGWCNDLSSYANWLLRNCHADMLCDIAEVTDDAEYEDILVELANYTLDDEYLEEMNRIPAVGSIYSCDGPFRFQEYEDEEEIF